MKKSEVVFILVGVGWYVALSLLLPFGIGFWLDKKKFNSFPLLSLVGLGLGTIIMVFGVYRMIQKVQGEDKTNPNSKNQMSSKLDSDLQARQADRSLSSNQGQNPKK